MNNLLELAKSAKKTTDYFCKTVNELLEIRNEYNYTREECLLFDSGEEIVFFDNQEELEKDVEDFQDYIKSKEYEIKTVVSTINGRMAFILVY